MDLDKARPLQYKANQLLTALFQHNVSAHKYALELMGRPAGQARKPIQPLTPEAEMRLKETLKSLGILDEEPRGW
jgi:dihydrodipicolinate synthase/N-acetylneuraminate lyase